MKQIDKEFFTTLIDRIINAYDCEVDKFPNDRCEFCPYGYGYLDDRGDRPFWWCDDYKIEADAIKMLRILKEKI